MRPHRSNRLFLVVYIRKLTAVIGLTLAALSLTGSREKSATLFLSNPDFSLAGEARRQNQQGRSFFASGRYLDARSAFHSAAEIALRAGDLGLAATNWSNAGGSALARLDYRGALGDLRKAREIARRSRSSAALASTLNNLASLYLQIGNTAAAIEVANEALAGPAQSAGAGIQSRLRVQLAGAFAASHHFDQAEGLYRTAVAVLEDQQQFETAVQVRANWADYALDANRLDEAEAVLDQAFYLFTTHCLNPDANVFRTLAKLRARRGDLKSAATLFDAALNSRDRLTPRWLILADRGEFRLDHGDLPGALADFREAHRLAMEMRLDVVPADQDRVALESTLSRSSAGFIEAGNRLAMQTGDKRLFQETFDIAEQERLWSLRALIPMADDWRKHLPETYWDLLARYQSAERALLARPSAELKKQTSDLQLRLEEMEANASPGAEPNRSESALRHIRSVIDGRTTLFSFYLTNSGGWIWAIDRTGLDVRPISQAAYSRARITDFTHALQEARPASTALGRQLYQDLFGAIPRRYLAHKRWLLEPDGSLFDVPFAALVADIRKNEPIYIIHRASLEVIPGAMMVGKAASEDPGNKGFLGIGDPVYNAADPRYTGARDKKQNLWLPRLVETASELRACSLALGTVQNRILIGRDADLATVRAALQSSPSVIHFATHIITAPADHASGLIALSLDRSGAMGLIGPTEIVAHRISSNLVVLNGCHSAQGEALPDSGLMGLTRAWIGAGAKAVLATRWDIPDRSGEAVMVGFYRVLRVHPELGASYALRMAQLAILRGKSIQDSRGNAAIWAAYFLLGRE